MKVLIAVILIVVLITIPALCGQLLRRVAPVAVTISPSASNAHPPGSGSSNPDPVDPDPVDPDPTPTSFYYDLGGWVDGDEDALYVGRCPSCGVLLFYSDSMMEHCPGCNAYLHLGEDEIVLADDYDPEPSDPEPSDPDPVDPEPSDPDPGEVGEVRHYFYYDGDWEDSNWMSEDFPYSYICDYCGNYLHYSLDLVDSDDYCPGCDTHYLFGEGGLVNFDYIDDFEDFDDPFY